MAHGRTPVQSISNNSVYRFVADFHTNVSCQMSLLPLKLNRTCILESERAISVSLLREGVLVYPNRGENENNPWSHSRLHI